MFKCIFTRPINQLREFVPTSEFFSTSEVFLNIYAHFKRARERELGTEPVSAHTVGTGKSIKYK